MLKVNKNVFDLVTFTKSVLTKESQSKKLILIRSCENIGSLSGCLNGWIDAKLSEYGRKQAKYLSIEYFSQFDFKNAFISDLVRAKESADICLGYDMKVKYNVLPELREIYFGEQEGLFYDGLPPDEKKELSKKTHKFRGGESWMDVKYRGIKFLSQLDFSNRSELIFTHGGLIASLLQAKGMKSQPPNGSVTIITLSKYFENRDTGEYKSVLNEFSKQYNCPDASFNEVFFNRYNPAFEDYIDKAISSIDFVYQLPDLTEELI